MWQQIEIEHKDLLKKMTSYCGQLPDGRSWIGKGYIYKICNWFDLNGIKIERLLSTVNPSDEMVYLCRIKKTNIVFEEYVEGSYQSWKTLIQKAFNELSGNHSIIP